MDIKTLPQDVRAYLKSGSNISTINQCVMGLIFNSLDAKATAIAIRINLSSFRIQVVDNGNGITKCNMSLVGIRYMTNKCQSLADLKKIKTFGFRGETVDSIKTMCKKITISSRPKDVENSYQKIGENGKWGSVEIIKQRPSTGTTITIEGFMNNFPVRQKRIDPNMDLNEIKKSLEALAVIHYKVSFNLRNDATGKIIFDNRKSQSVSEALINRHPNISIEDLSDICISKGKITISGLIYKKPYSSTIQYIYCNKQPIASNKIQNVVHTILQKSVIFQKSSKNMLNDFIENPVYILNIRCPKSEVDVTSNPLNKNIEFKNWDMVLSIIEKTVLKCLELEHLIEPNTIETKPNSPKVPSFKSRFGVSQVKGAVKGVSVKRRIYKLSKNEKNAPKIKNYSNTNTTTGDNQKNKNPIVTSVVHLTKEKKAKPTVRKERLNWLLTDADVKLMQTNHDANVNIKTHIKSDSRNIKQINNELTLRSDENNLEKNVENNLEENVNETSQPRDNIMLNKNHNNLETSTEKSLMKRLNAIIVSPINEISNTFPMEHLEVNNNNSISQDYNFNKHDHNLKSIELSVIPTKSNINDERKGKDVIMTKFLKSTRMFQNPRRKILDTTLMTVSLKVLSKKTIVTNTIPAIKKSKCLKQINNGEKNGKWKRSSPQRFVSKCIQTTMIEHQEEFKLNFCVTQPTSYKDTVHFANPMQDNICEVTFSRFYTDFNTNEDINNCYGSHTNNYRNNIFESNRQAPSARGGFLNFKDIPYERSRLNYQNSMLNIFHDKPVYRPVKRYFPDCNYHWLFHSNNQFQDTSLNINGFYRHHVPIDSFPVPDQPFKENSVIPLYKLYNPYKYDHLRSINCNFPQYKTYNTDKRAEKFLQKQFRRYHDIDFNLRKAYNDGFKKLYNGLTDFEDFSSNPKYFSKNQWLQKYLKENQVHRFKLNQPQPFCDRAYFQHVPIGIKNKSDQNRLKTKRRELYKSVFRDDQKNEFKIPKIPRKSSKKKKQPFFPSTHTFSRHNRNKEGGRYSPYFQKLDLKRNNRKVKSRDTFQNMANPNDLGNSNFTIEINHFGNENRTRETKENHNMANCVANGIVQHDVGKYQCFEKYQPNLLFNENNTWTSLKDGNLQRSIATPETNFIRNNIFCPTTARFENQCSNMRASNKNGEKYNLFTDTKDMHNFQFRPFEENGVIEKPKYLRPTFSVLNQANVSKRSKGHLFKKFITTPYNNSHLKNRTRTNSEPNLHKTDMYNLNNNRDTGSDTLFSNFRRCQNASEVFHPSNNEHDIQITQLTKNMDYSISTVPASTEISRISVTENQEKADAFFENFKPKLCSTKLDIFENSKSPEYSDIIEESPVKNYEYLAPSLKETNLFSRNQQCSNVKNTPINISISSKKKEELLKMNLIGEHQQNINQISTSENSTGQQWIKNVNSLGNVFYLHKRNGMTILSSPKCDPGFQFTKRFEFAPKGFSPILVETEKVKTLLSPASRKSLYAEILRSYESELTTVKWINYIRHNEPKQFFEDLYQEKIKQLENHLPINNTLPSITTKLDCNFQAQSFSHDIFSQMQVIGQLDKKFIICLSKPKMLIIIFDQHAVHERVRLEMLLKDYKEVDTKFKSISCREIKIILSEDEINFMLQFRSQFKNIGLGYTVSEKIIKITKIPYCIYKKFLENDGKLKQDNLELENTILCLIYELLDMINVTRGVILGTPQILQNIINSQACRGAIKFGDEMNIEQCQHAINELSKCKLPYQCAHGRPTLIPLINLEGNCVVKNSKPKLNKLNVGTISEC